MTPDPDALLAAAQQAHDAGDLPRAKALCAQVLDRGRRNPRALHLMGAILQAQDRLDEAAGYIEQFIRLRPKEIGGHHRLGTIESSRGRYAQAIARFDKVLKLRPGFTAAVDGKAYVYVRKGDYDKVGRLLGPYVRAGTENVSMALSYGRMLLHEGRLDEAADLLRRHIAQPGTTRAQRRTLHFHLGKVLEGAGDYDAAFEAYATANREGAARNDARVYETLVQQLTSVFSAESLSRMARADHGLDVPVLVVGMPRTGSTLVEQIIAMHPAAAAAGETTALRDLIGRAPSVVGSTQPYPFCMIDATTASAGALGEAYVAELRGSGRAAQRIVDKNLLNYEALGFVALIAPQARIIDCRRDPMDTCVSCFMEPLNENLHPYASDLAALGSRYRHYERLMTHWHDVLDLPMLTLQYEELIADQETQTRRIIEFLGLPWNDGCLKPHESKREARTLSHEQVKRPIYATSVRRHERFAAHLEPLRRSLTG